MKINCNIIQDLIPLVNDGVASQESEQLVLTHCQECEECSQLLDKKPLINDIQLNKKWKKKIRITLLGMMVLVMMLACSFSGTMHQFQNFILMPTIGILSYGILKKKIYYVYILISLIQCLMSLLSSEYHWTMIFYIPIYWLLLSTGIAIYICFHYAFKGGK